MEGATSTLALRGWQERWYCRNYGGSGLCEHERQRSAASVPRSAGAAVTYYYGFNCRRGDTDSQRSKVDGEEDPNVSGLQRCKHA